MKTLSMNLNTFRQRGVALVIVLSVLLLMSAMLVAFMSSVSTERVSQRAAYSSFEAQQVAESAVNLVISQIRAATTEIDDGSQGWASQPGAIHTFGSNAKVFKLYSAARMQESEANYSPGSPDESGMSPSTPGISPGPEFVDLNQAVLIPASDGRVDPHYPIVDPRAALTRDGRAANSGNGKVEGFWVPQDMKHPSRAKDTSGIDVMELPMRVRWLYQLRDGSIVAPDNNKRLPGASKQNPPIARMAFWTDDESAKLNVNTAGENTYWDTPMASGYTETGHAPSTSGGADYSWGESAALAAVQPTKTEYQRFPGHPATTNLSPALRWLYPTSMKDWEFKEALYRLTPRLRSGQGSSMGGSLANYPGAAFQDVRLNKRDRLFASLDEFWFRPDRSPISGRSYFGAYTTTSMNPDVDPTFVDQTPPNNPIGSPQALEQLRFFLSASSRAPELNLFGLPRVSIWPVHERDDPNPATSKRSAYDDLIAFCSTIADKPYYFTRAQPWSPTYDYDKSGPAPTDINNTPYPERNKKLLLGSNSNGYLRRLSGRSIPGVGGTFASKYSAGGAASGGFTEIDRILLSIFDYIRCINLIDTGKKGDAVGKFAYTPGYSLNNNYTSGAVSVLGSGQVVPSVIYAAAGTPGQPSTPLIKGFGRFINLSEVGLCFFRDATVLAGENAPPTVSATQQVISFRCVLLPETFTVSAYFPGMCEGYAYKVQETKPFVIRYSNPQPSGGPAVQQNLELAKGDLNYVNVNPYRVPYGRFWMPSRGFTNQFWYEDGGAPKMKKFERLPTPAATILEKYQRYPFYSKRIDFVVPKPAAGSPTPPTPEFTLEDGRLEFEFYPLDVNEASTPNPNKNSQAATTLPLQRIEVNFPTFTLRIPEETTAGSNIPFLARVAARPGNGNPINAGDRVRTVESNGLAKGDFRFVAGSTNVRFDQWSTSGAAGEYGDKTKNQIHNFRNGHGDPLSGARYAKLSPNGTTYGAKYAKTPILNGTALAVNNPTVAGDFDRGISKHIDGPFINKPDEGNTQLRLDLGTTSGNYLPYYRGDDGYEEVGESFFSPNRLVSSAAMFGSLPSGIFAQRPWETLLFAPPVTADHKGKISPADHYMLDWFTMPVVEPYAISEPLSTMGKINLNSRLAPFGYVKVSDGGAQRSYIQRHTGLFGVFKGVRQLVISAPSDAGHRERPLEDTGTKYRYEVDPQVMMDNVIDPALDDRKFFKSATEICELDLPLKDKFSDKPGTAGKWKAKYNDTAGRRAFWTANDMSGDNARERPYSHIYPRLTTKSNVYTVHVWTQSIAKNPSTKDWAIFDDATDRVLGEYRGSTTIERYIDVEEDALKNYDAVVQDNARSLDPYYRFRVVNTKRFNPQ